MPVVLKNAACDFRSLKRRVNQLLLIKVLYRAKVFKKRKDIKKQLEEKYCWDIDRSKEKEVINLEFIKWRGSEKTEEEKEQEQNSWSKGGVDVR